MSFDAHAHRTPASSLPPMSHALFGFTPFSEDGSISKQIATLQVKLDKKLGPEYISQRPGPDGGPELTYAKGWKIINLTNEVFGFNGWSSSILSITTDFLDYSEDSKRFNVGVTATVRVTLKDGAYHEDVGYGMLENESKGTALGKSYIQEVVKIKVPPAKLDKNDLYRRSEFEERILDGPAPARAVVPEGSSSRREKPHRRRARGPPAA
ncbi:hypothetical protein HD554DRAFT_2173328 [Boletus coccyginus]|nr:hypothetical protein HD554DRAFT_2173328 [Boletus coccyginus]